MAIEKVKQYFDGFGIAERIKEFDCSSATVAEAAQAVGCDRARIAKTLSFIVGSDVVLIVTAGDMKIDNSKFKAYFSTKARMVPPDDAEPLIGHCVGGICPFAVNEGASIYLDQSLRRFDTVYPACGSSNSAIELNLEELERFSRPTAWIDVCKPIAD